MSFIHLHTHTEYSLLDGITKIPLMLAQTIEDGNNSIAITDHGSMYGLYEFWKACHESNIKPIIGCEMYVVANRHDKGQTNQKPFHLPIIAKNLEGYHNLIKLVSLANLEGFYYKARIDRDLLQKYYKELIVLSGSEFGEVRSSIELGNIEQARQTLTYYKNLFGENYYIELTPELKKEEKVNELNILISLSKELNIKMVATDNLYYMKRKDSKVQEIVWSIADGKKLTEPSRRKTSYSHYYRSEAKMREIWKDMPEAIDITQKIADQIEDYKIGYGLVEPLSIDVPSNTNSKDWLIELAYEGATNKFSTTRVNLPQVVKDRLEYELGLIALKGYNDYFLVVREYVQWSNNNGIPTSCRGSGASSLVAYCVGITPLDPLRWKLPFERFLNPERNSLPDFDIDFADDKREMVFQHMIDKYGVENTSNICAIGRMKSRAVIKDVGRVMDVPLPIIDKLSKLVTVKFGKPASLKEMLNAELHPEFSQIVSESKELQKLIKISSRIENNARHISTHACGFIYVPKCVSDLVPIQKETKGGNRIITQIEGSKMEDLGLMKFDFLGVANLSSIAVAVELIKKRHGIVLDMRKIPEDDKKTFELLQRTDTAGIFQLESDGMRKYLKDLKPTKVEDISFMCAAYRPGPMKFIEPYIKRKHGKEEVTYPHPDLIPVLEETYGYAIYQEQVMTIAQVFAGYTLGAADVLRRAMGKKKAEVMAMEKGKFVQMSIDKGHTKEEAEEIFSYLEPFADYGFNKAHSAAYCMIAYQTAYLKANYTIEFIAALMQCDIEKPEKLIRDIEEARSHGLEVLPPDVNKSNEDFTIVDDKTILFGLAGLKGIGRGQVSEIVQKRLDTPFVSFQEFLERVDQHKISKSAIELLTKVGAFEKYGTRAEILCAIPTSLEIVQKMQLQQASGQFDLFGSTTNKQLLEIKKLPEVSDMQKVTWEKDILGVFLSEHPLIKYEQQFKKIGVAYSTEISDKRSRSKTKVIGIVNKVKEIRTKKDNSLMCFGEIEDPYGNISITIFPKAYASCKEKFKAGQMLLILGSIDKREEGISILVDEVKLIDESKLKPDLILQAGENMISCEQTEVKIPTKDTIVFKSDTKNTITDDSTYSISSVDNKISSFNKIRLYLSPQTDISRLQQLSDIFKSSIGDTNLELFFSSEKKVVLKNGIRYDELFKEKIRSVVPDSKFEVISF